MAPGDTITSIRTANPDRSGHLPIWGHLHHGHFDHGSDATLGQGSNRAEVLQHGRSISLAG